jgi:hypothetical protein
MSVEIIRNDARYRATAARLQQTLVILLRAYSDMKKIRTQILGG